MGHALDCWGLLLCVLLYLDCSYVSNRNSLSHSSTDIIPLLSAGTHTGLVPFVDDALFSTVSVTDHTLYPLPGTRMPGNRYHIIYPGIGLRRMRRA